MKKLLKFLKDWNELVTLPLALLLWWYSSSILRLIDETAGVYDVGILQAFLLGTAGILLGHALIWIVIKLSNNEIYRTLDDFLIKNDLTSWQKGLFSLLYWGFLLVAWAILVAGMS
jgi:hypothetical protein